MDVNLDRLCFAMQRARLALRYCREERVAAVREFVGGHWSEETASREVPVNLLALYVSIVGRNLIANHPRFTASTFDRASRPAVATMQAWGNKEIQRLKLKDTLERLVVDALFSLSVGKVSLADPAESAASAWAAQAGKPKLSRVDLDDFVYDVHARDFSEPAFIGHRYRVPLDVVKDSKLYSKERLNLEASRDDPYNAEGDQRAGVLGRGFYESNSEEFEDYVDLWEVYLPRHRQVFTLEHAAVANAVSGGAGRSGKPLRVQKWLGPASGPYHMLAYGVVPANAMPKSPLQDLIDLHRATNNIYRKSIEQARRQKQVLPVRNNDETGDRILSASDGEAIRCDGDPPQPVSYGGPDAGNLQLGVHLKDLFMTLAGNLEMIGGLSPQSKTLGQDKLLAENASRTVADMQDRTIGFVSEVLEAMCWYWWHDPFTTMAVAHKLEGLPDIGIKRKLTPERRQQLRFEELDLQIDPFSLQHLTPQARLQILTQTMQQIILPAMPILQQQGIGVDMNAYLSKVAQYSNLPDLTEILTIAEPPAGPQGGGMAQPGMPQSSSREYVRRSLGGDTAQNREAGMLNGQGAMTGNSKPSANGSLSGVAQ